MGVDFPDPDADPFCVEFDKTQQNITDLGILDFLVNEPARVAAAVPKCFYYQTDHWTGSIVQGEAPELWHWDGQYFFDKARAVGGVNLQNFRILGYPASFRDYVPFPPEYAPYFDQHGGGTYLILDIPADPSCVAKVDTAGGASRGLRKRHRRSGPGRPGRGEQHRRSAELDRRRQGAREEAKYPEGEVHGRQEVQARRAEDPQALPQAKYPQGEVRLASAPACCPISSSSAPASPAPRACTATSTSTRRSTSRSSRSPTSSVERRTARGPSAGSGCGRSTNSSSPPARRCEATAPPVTPSTRCAAGSRSGSRSWFPTPATSISSAIRSSASAPITSTMHRRSGRSGRCIRHSATSTTPRTPMCAGSSYATQLERYLDALRRRARPRRRRDRPAREPAPGAARDLRLPRRRPRVRVTPGFDEQLNVGSYKRAHARPLRAGCATRGSATPGGAADPDPQATQRLARRASAPPVERPRVDDDLRAALAERLAPGGPAAARADREGLRVLVGLAVRVAP